MKKILSILLSAFLLAAPLTCFAEPDSEAENASPSDIIMENADLEEPDVDKAEAALLMDLKTGRLLFGKNVERKLFPASTTKIMTGILALEMGNMEDVVTATYEAIKDITLEDSHMGILIGEELTFEQLLYGMMVYSANDAANVIAIHLAGSMDAFVEKMNAKAVELGMKNTHFKNACGMHNDEHYTTAEDLAILAKYCMQNEKFREIVKTATYKIAPTNKYAKERILPNTNLFLGTSRSRQHYYAPCTGIKTGHTSKAGYCLVSSAEYKDISLLAVVLNCDNVDTGSGAYSYTNSKRLFEFGFNNYSSQKIASPGDVISDSKVYEAKDNTRVALTVSEDIFALIPKNTDTENGITQDVEMPEELQAPIAKGTVLGKVTYSINGVQLASADLVAANEVKQDKILFIIHTILNVLTSPFFFIPAILIIIIAIISRNQKRKRERKKKLNQLKKNRQRASGEVPLYRTPDRNAARTEIRRSESQGSNSRYKK